MNTTHLMINIYMVTVKRNYQVFALGIRFGGWISVCSRAEWRIGNSVGGTWRDFIRGGRWWWHKTLKLSLSLRISLCILLFLPFLLVLPSNTPLWHIVSTHIYLTLRCRLEDWEGKCCNFKDQNVRGWILDLFCQCPRSIRSCTHHYLSVLFVV